MRSGYCLFDIFGTAVTSSITMYTCKEKTFKNEVCNRAIITTSFDVKNPSIVLNHDNCFLVTQA